MSYDIVQGDLEPDMPMTVSSSLVGATSVEMRWKKPSGELSTVSLVIISAAAGTVRRVWVAGDTEEVGKHQCRVVVTWPGSEPQTFPSDGNWAQWYIHARE